MSDNPQRYHYKRFDADHASHAIETWLNEQDQQGYSLVSHVPVSKWDGYAPFQSFIFEHKADIHAAHAKHDCQCPDCMVDRYEKEEAEATGHTANHGTGTHHGLATYERIEVREASELFNNAVHNLTLNGWRLFGGQYSDDSGNQVQVLLREVRS